MKLFRLLLVIGIFAGLTLATGCSSFDFNNPTATEWNVQIVGDSVFDLSGDIQNNTEDLIRQNLQRQIRERSQDCCDPEPVEHGTRQDDTEDGHRRRRSQ